MCRGRVSVIRNVRFMPIAVGTLLCTARTLYMVKYRLHILTYDLSIHALLERNYENIVISKRETMKTLYCTYLCIRYD